MTSVAAIQMCSSHVVQDNLKQAAQWIQQATLSGAKLVVLPEMFSLLGLHESDKVAAKENFASGMVQDFLQQQAKQHGIWLVGGTIPLATENPQLVRAACLVYNDQGIVVARYDKIHLFDVVLSPEEIYTESATIEAGETMTVVDSPVGKLGLAVCYDLRFPELFRRMREEGVEVIAIPAAFTEKTGKAHWEILLKARAIENQCYVIGANQTGCHTHGKTTFGHSMVINPWGLMLAGLSTEVGVVTAEIDLAELERIRRSMPVEAHRKIK